LGKPIEAASKAGRCAAWTPKMLHINNLRVTTNFTPPATGCYIRFFEALSGESETKGFTDMNGVVMF
jgi:hypothetical protein